MSTVPYDQSPLDPEASRAARDAGIEAIKAARHKDYLLIRSVALRLLNRYEKVNSDDVRSTLNRSKLTITHENVVGAVFNHLAAEGSPHSSATRSRKPKRGVAV